jgi:hypothetical protein
LTTRPDGTPLLKVLDFGISKVPIDISGAPLPERASRNVTCTSVVGNTPTSTVQPIPDAAGVPVAVGIAVSSSHVAVDYFVQIHSGP